jgi:hypothetical protein
MAGNHQRAYKCNIAGGLPVALRVTPRRTPWFAGLLQQPGTGCEEGVMKKIGMLTATLLAALLLVSPFAFAGNPKGVCQAGGVNRVVLADAMAKYWTWYYGGVGTQQVGRLFLVPLPTNGEQISDDPLIYQGSTSFTVRTGRTLVLPLSFFVGESYVEGPPDDPADYPTDYKASSLLLTVDGRVIADSRRTKLDCLYVDLTYFPQPIVYPEPSSYGSNAAIWMTGLGILLPPMSPGEHVIDMQVVSPLPFWGIYLGYYNTWYVTVVKP